jgi:hypothetical protein
MSENTRSNPVIPPDVLGRIPLRGDDMANELAAIRAELQALRKMLTPPKSVILTGPEVERVFSALKGGAA